MRRARGGIQQTVGDGAVVDRAGGGDDMLAGVPATATVSPRPCGRGDLALQRFDVTGRDGPISRSPPPSRSVLPHEGCGHPGGGHVYVTNQGANTVSVIDTPPTNTVTTVPVGLGADSIAVTPDGSRVHVGNYTNGTISVIDTATNMVAATAAGAHFERGKLVERPGTNASGTTAAA
jgi:YVTN family beta-propeller protein